MKTSITGDMLTTLAKLNSFARVEYSQQLEMRDCVPAIYAMKRWAILEAIKAGICKVRLVSVERPCKTCKGTGDYEWVDWNDEDHREYETCRRCSGTPGRVTLRFIETDILGQRWHTPRPKAGFLAGFMESMKLSWEKCETTDWTPERPGKPLTRSELLIALNDAERGMCDGKILRWHNGWKGSVFDYSLYFGEIEECFVCGHPAKGHSWATFPNSRNVFRPGMRWNQHICPDCEARADRWPRSWPSNLMPHHDRGRWIDEYPRWTMNAPFPAIARTEIVQEWLARRGIVEGLPVPSELCHLAGGDSWVDLIAIRGDESFVRISDSQHWAHAGYNGPLLKVPTSRLRSRNLRLLEAVK